jgi:DNA polymerase elongation subunit (family B)
MLFLWNAGFSDTSREVTLEFYDSSSGKLEKAIVKDYQPYFLTHYPLSKAEEDAVAGLEGQSVRVTKQHLFTGDSVQLTQVKAWTPVLLKKLAREFDNVWENEIEYSRSYIYDHNLVFGAPYSRQGDSFILNRDVPRELRGKFETAFSHEEKTSSLKYAQIKEWFSLCSQPVPNVGADLLGKKGKQENTESWKGGDAGDSEETLA